MTVQRCKIRDESIRHAMHMGEHMHISSAWVVIYLRVQCSPVSTFAPKRVMDVEWGFMMIFGQRAFRGLRHPWLGKKMDSFADSPLLHCFNSESQRGTSPADFGLHIKR